MDIITLQGTLAAGIGIVLFLMGYYKGTSNGIENAVQSMFKLGVLALDADDNVIPGPQIHKAHKQMYEIVITNNYFVVVSGCG